MPDGSIQGFISRTDLIGRTVQSVRTGRFSPHQVCEVTGGTVWSLGYDWGFRNLPDADHNVLHHYSFERGLLGSLVSLDSISKDSHLSISDRLTNYLRCSNDRVSVYLGYVAEYIEVDASTGNLSRWNVDVASAVGSETNGFAVTDEGKIFVDLDNERGPNGERKHGLYELRAEPGNPIASLPPVDGTVTVFESSKTVPEGTFLELWGADGNSLVVSRMGDGWGLSWARVFATRTSPE